MPHSTNGKNFTEIFILGTVQKEEAKYMDEPPYSEYHLYT
jgi:hypothetical protein